MPKFTYNYLFGYHYRPDFTHFGFYSVSETERGIVFRNRLVSLYRSFEVRHEWRYGYLLYYVRWFSRHYLVYCLLDTPHKCEVYSCIVVFDESLLAFGEKLIFHPHRFVTDTLHVDTYSICRVENDTHVLSGMSNTDIIRTIVQIRLAAIFISDSSICLYQSMKQ